MALGLALAIGMSTVILPLALVLIAGTAVALGALLVSSRTTATGWWEPARVGAIFLILTFVVRPLQLHWRGDLNDSDVRPLVMSFAFCSLAATAYLAVRKRVAFPLPHPLPWPTSAVGGPVIAALALAGGGILFATSGSGGPLAVVADAANRRDNLEGQYYFLSLIAFAEASALLVVAEVAFRRRSWRWALPILGAVAILLLPRGSRGDYLRFGLLLLGTWHVCGRETSRRAALAAAFAGIVIVSLGLELRLATRFEGREVEPFAVLDVRRSAPKLIDDGFTGYDRFRIAVPAIPEIIPHQYWTTYGRLVTAPLPRSFFPNKSPVSEASVTGPLFRTVVGRYPIGPVGVAWLQAGWLGIVVNAVTLGLLWAVIHWRISSSGGVERRIIWLVIGASTFAGLDNLAILQTMIRVTATVMLFHLVRLTSQLHLRS